MNEEPRESMQHISDPDSTGLAIQELTRDLHADIQGKGWADRQGVPFRAPVPLKPYQEEAVKKLVSNGGGGLFMEVGLGKTLTVLSALTRLDRPFPVLVVAPKAVAVNTWPSELNKWFPSLRFGVAVGSRAQCITAIKAHPQILITNYERLPLLVETKQIAMFTTVILDESSKIKTTSTKRTKIVLRHAHWWKYKFILSGTPMPNGQALEIFPQILFLDGGERLGKTLCQVRNEYCEAHVQYFGQRMVRNYTTPKAKFEKLQAKISDICVSAMAKDHLSIESHTVQHRLALTAGQRSRYTTLKDDAILTLENSEDQLFDTGPIINRLLQFTSGSVYVTEDGTRRSERVSEAKLDFLAELAESIDGNVLIAYNFQFERDMLAERFPGIRFFGEENTTALIDEWNDGKIPYAGIQPARAGHGLNLQHGGHTMIWFSLPWSFELYEQCCGRLARRGQEHPVMIHHLITEGTADGYAQQKLIGKGRINTSLLEYLRGEERCQTQ